MQNNLALVSLKKLQHNAACVSTYLGATPFFAVVKDDAYGHGAVEVAHALSPYVYAFAVATVDEGATLRIAGITKDILVLTPPLCREEVIRGGTYGLIFTLPSFAVLHLMERVAREFSLTLRAHLAVNTGMNRLGVRPSLVRSLCEEGKQSPVRVEGIYSHLYAPENRRAREGQLNLFLRACDVAQGVLGRLTRHLAATGGMLVGERYFLDGVRSGIALYGYLPSGFEGLLSVEPVMKLYSHTAQSGRFIGGGVGYASAQRDYGNLHTVRLGYGDGLFRAGEIGIGRLCMDAHVREGESRMGRRVLVLSDVYEYAKKMGTIPYEILCRMGAKAVKVYER